jgi:hypothetical protein
LENAEPDWLADIAPAAEMADLSADDTGEESALDWMAEDEIETDSAPIVTRILTSDEDEFETAAEWSDEEEDQAETKPDPILASAPLQTQILSDYEYDFETPAELDSTESVSESFMDDDDLEQVLAAADAPPPAENAPDWLNAMVPGLDLDYEATEDDAPLESAYVESATPRAQPVAPAEEEAGRNFDWLVEIVDEETSEFTPIREEAPASKGQRFSFSRQPAWLRVPTDQEDAENTDDDFELPDWLQ